MQDYYSVGAISTEIGVSDKKIYKVAKDLGLNTKEIGENEKKLIKEACLDTILRKKQANELVNDLKSAKLDKSGTIYSKSGSTLEERLLNAKQDYDKVIKNILACDFMIETNGEFITNSNNGAVSPHPALKTKCELLKQKNALDKTINELEEKLKLSKSTSEEKRSVIGDE